jgi:hypothetical protein
MRQSFKYFKLREELPSAVPAGELSKALPTVSRSARLPAFKDNYLLVLGCSVFLGSAVSTRCSSEQATG